MNYYLIDLNTDIASIAKIGDIPEQLGISSEEFIKKYESDPTKANYDLTDFQYLYGTEESVKDLGYTIE